MHNWTEISLSKVADWLYLSTISIRRAVSGNPGVLGCAGHFEKNLYDNALLSRVYLHAYQASVDPFFRRLVEETPDYVLREMTSALVLASTRKGISGLVSQGVGEGR
jgi:hypothetical protein